MSMDWVGIVTVALGVVMLRVRPERAFQILIVSVLFQAAAALKLASNGIAPPHLLLAFLAVVLVVKGGPETRFDVAMRYPKGGFWLAIFSVWCAIAGFFLPQLFAGVIDVFPIASDQSVADFHPLPLEFSRGNLTQSIYILGSLFVFLSTYAFCRAREGARAVCDGLLFFCIGNVLFAGVDLLGFQTGHTELLDAVHNGNYVMHTSETVAGFHRISGTFSETAAFSFITLSTLPFTTVLATNRYRTRLNLALSIAQLLFLVISTSTTAYVGLAAVFIYLFFSYVAKLGARGWSKSEAIFVLAAPLLAAAAVMLVCLNREASDSIADFLNAVLFDKGMSDSGLERASLNAQATDNFLSTWGLGVGTGSVRASSFLLALPASVGLPGIALFAAFLYRLFFSRGAHLLGEESRTFRDAALAGCVGGLAAATISGALIDMGLLFFIFAALAHAASEHSHESTLSGSENMEGSVPLLRARPIVLEPSTPAAT